jgi:glycosyltransferase involved in cell wall biosynthesis
MHAPIAIFYLITSTNVGGAEKAVLQLIRNLDRQEFKIYVCSIKKPGAFAKAFAAEADGFFSLNLAENGGITALINFIPGLLLLIRLLRRTSPAILHCFLFRANLLGRIAGSITGVPVIISSIRVIETGSLFKNVFDRLTAVLTDKYIAVSDAARDYTIKHSKISSRKIITIYNGIESRNTYLEPPVSRRDIAVDENDIVLALIGRLHKQKGHLLLLKALPFILPEAPRIKVIFCGEGEEETFLRGMVENMGLAGHVRFLGIIENASRILPLVDILVLPSHWEGMPHVVLEAMAAGRPVVASRIEGLDELVEDGKTGLLFLSGDPRSLAEALLKLINNSELARNLGKAARERVMKKFQLKETVQNTVRLYQKLLAEKLKDAQ